MRQRRVRGLAVILLCGMSLVGCAEPRPQEPLTIPIASFKVVAGKWEGMVTREPFSRDWAEFTIYEDGRFDFLAHRDYIGVARGSGVMRLVDGVLKSESERGTGTYTLVERDGQRMLLVDALSKKGLRYRAELTRAGE